MSRSVYSSIELLSQKVHDISSKLEPVLRYDFYGSELIQEIEKKFKEEVNFFEPILVNSGSMAFCACLMAMGYKKGTEILLPVNICQSMVNVVILLGYIPVFVDIDRNLCMSKEDMKNKITYNTGAVLYVYSFGYPADIEDIYLYCQERNITLIEDCAQAPFAAINNKRVGTFGEIAIYSFGQNKPISAGGGGIISCKDEKMAHEIRIIAREGTDDFPNYSKLGFHLSVNELHALLILYKINNLERTRNEKREKISLYKKYFHNTIEYVGKELNDLKNCEHNFHKFILKVPFETSREYNDFIKTLEKKYDEDLLYIMQPSFPLPTYKVNYLKEYLVSLGRKDLANLSDKDFPVFSNLQNQYLYFSTHDLICKSDIERVSEVMLNELSKIRY